MKLTKYLMIAGAAFLLTACSSDDWNTSGNVTVEMAQATMTVKENANIFKVPLKLQGKTNGPVKVEVSVAEYSESPAKADIHYFLTSSSVVFPTDSANVGLEFVAVNDMEINSDRAFIVTITKVEGAKIGNQATTVVTIKDDDGLFYEAIQGNWTFSGVGFFDGAPIKDSWTIRGFDEGDANYEKILEISGWGGQSGLVAEVEYNYDETNDVITLYFPFGQTLGQLNFSGLGACDVVLYGVLDGYLNDEGGAYAVVSSDLRTINFDPNEIFYYGVEQNGEYLGGWDGVEEMIVTR